ncbi:MAG: glycosyltransferase family 4 protein [Phormidesmis sp.]
MVSTLNLAKQNGGKVHFTSLAQGFRAQGHQVDAILSTTGDRATDRHIAQQYFHHVTFTSTLLSRLIPISKTSVNSLLQTQTALHIDPKAYDWVYFRSTPLSLSVLKALQMQGFKKIFVEHNGWFAHELVMMGFPARLKGWLEKLQTAEAQSATRLRVVVPGIRERLLAKVQNPAELDKKLVVIGNGADVDYYRPLDRADAIATIGLNPHKRYLGFIGDLDPWQGVEVAIQAMTTIRQQVPQAEILIVGAGRQLAPLKATYGDLDYVHFFGSVPYAQSNTYINCFDIALLPKQGLSGIGYSPIKLYTYAAAGRTILASRIRGIKEYGEEYGGAKGFITLHKPGDAADMAAQACQLIGDTKRCVHTATTARQYAEAHFSWQLVADKITQTMQAYDRQSVAEPLL